mgnify:CR=1 FL=1
MLVQAAPFFKTVEGILILKDQIVCYGEYLLISTGKALLQIIDYAKLTPDAIKKIGRSVKTSGCFCCWYRSSFCSYRSIFLFTAPAVSGGYLARFTIYPSDQGSF